MYSNKYLIIKSMVACLLLSGSLSVMADRAQYGFWHRVNNPDYIHAAINYPGQEGPEGLEIDICYENSNSTWYVSHYDANVCSGFGIATLSSWLRTFKSNIDSLGNYHLSALWLDIKTPNSGDLKDVVNLVRNAKLNQTGINVIFDLGNVNTSLTGFHRIKGDLQWNEGIGFWVNSVADAATIYNLYQANDVVKGMAHSGHSANIDERYIDAIQHYMVNVKGTYGFKRNFTWTNRLVETMEAYMVLNKTRNPDAQCRTYNCYTDGQIVGFVGPFYPGGLYFDEDIHDFHQAINNVNAELQVGLHRATRKDEFWGGWSLNPTLISVVM